MNPCPAGREIHPDLAGYRVFPITGFFLEIEFTLERWRKGHMN
jgi:hypothetical protein